MDHFWSLAIKTILSRFHWILFILSVRSWMFQSKLWEGEQRICLLGTYAFFTDSEPSLPKHWPFSFFIPDNMVVLYPLFDVKSAAYFFVSLRKNEPENPFWCGSFECYVSFTCYCFHWSLINMIAYSVIVMNSMKLMTTIDCWLDGMKVHATKNSWTILSIWKPTGEWKQ